MRACTVLAAFSIGCCGVSQADAQMTGDGPTRTYTPPIGSGGDGIDYAHSKPKPLPRAAARPLQAPNGVAPSLVFPGPPGFSEGSAGTGETHPTILFTPQSDTSPGPAGQAPGASEPDAYGTANLPYNTSRVDGTTVINSKVYPFSAAGKLFFLEGSTTYNCTGSLIKNGIVVTAAHCIADFGKGTYYKSWSFAPAYRNGTAPFGTWRGKNATILTSYLNGTDSCVQKGVTCEDDVGVIVLNPNGSGKLPGPATGVLSYGWNGYGFTSSGLALITQIGYPLDLDSGDLMERNDAQGFVDRTESNNTIIGSLMTGGSSGGPWAINWGIAPVLMNTRVGSLSQRNTVVGVTSWGSTTDAVKKQGAAPFTSNNIVVLVNAVCKANPGNC